VFQFSAIAAKAFFIHVNDKPMEHHRCQLDITLAILQHLGRQPPVKVCEVSFSKPKLSTP
jgi:hypothetical protein